MPAAMVMAQEANQNAADQTVIAGQGRNFTVAAKFQPDSGMLFYDKLDSQGRIIERIEKFYPIPPVSECNQITYGAFLQSLDSKNIAPLTFLNLTQDAQIQCCDFFSKGLGYQFTVCN
jgi:hypothetical protein